MSFFGSYPVFEHLLKRKSPLWHACNLMVDTPRLNGEESPKPLEERMSICSIQKQKHTQKKTCRKDGLPQTKKYKKNIRSSHLCYYSSQNESEKKEHKTTSRCLIYKIL